MNAKRANPLSIAVNHTLQRSGAFTGPPPDKRGRLSRWQRNTIDWKQMPEGGDGWCKRGIHAFWWATTFDMRTREASRRIMGPAPMFLPDESRDVVTSLCTQPPFWRRVLWFLGIK
jgi:hypothetical protein